MIRSFIIILLLPVYIYAQNADDHNRFFMGQNFEQSGNYSRAKEIYEELYTRYKNNYQYFDALNRVYLLLKEYDLSVSIIEERLRNVPGELNLLGMLGKTYHMAGDESKAYAAWDKAVQNAADNTAVIKLIANYAIERRAFNKAIDLLKKGKETAPDDEMFSFDLGNLYALLMQYENAAKEYCSMLLKKPEQFNLIEAKIITYINKPEALQQTIRVTEKSRKNSAVNNLLGRLYLEQKDFQKAYSVYLDLEDSNNKMGADLFKFAQYAYGENEFIYASKAFNEIISRYPESPYMPNAKLGYARTLEAGLINQSSNASGWKPFSKREIKYSSGFNEVISAYENVIKLFGGSDAAQESSYRIGMVKFHYQNDPAGAEEYFYKLILSAPYSRFASEAYLELGDIYLMQGNLDKAYESLAKITANERAPEDQKKSAEYRMARIKFYNKEFDESRNILSKLLLNLRDNSANDALELSLILNTAMNDSSNLVVFSEAEMMTAKGDYNAAVEMYKKLKAGNGISLLHHMAKIREAEMELALNNTENAVLLLEKIVDEKEKNIYADKALYLLARIYQHSAADNGSKAIEIYEDLLVKFPNSLYTDEAREEILKIRKKLS